MQTISNGVRGLNVMLDISFDRLLMACVLLMSLGMAGVLASYLLKVSVPVIDGIY